MCIIFYATFPKKTASNQSECPVCDQIESSGDVAVEKMSAVHFPATGRRQRFAEGDVCQKGTLVQ